MNDKIKRFAFYNIFFLCAFFSLFMVLNLKSFAGTRSYTVYGRNGYPNSGTNYNDYEIVYSFSDTYRYCIYIEHIGDSNGIPNYRARFLSNGSGTYSYLNYISSYNSSGILIGNNQVQSILTFTGPNNLGYYESQMYIGNNNFSGTLNIFYNLNDAENYILNGIIPNAFDQNLKLDSFKITSWKIGTSQLVFRSKLEVTWSDPEISNVQVKIVGTANSPASFESNSSPFKQKFYASNYVMKNGDVIHFTATPFKANGQYGESLYYSIIYEDGLPSNWYRKLVNTPYNDNTLTIPYNDVSGQPQSVTLPVDAVTTQNVYKVNYNPVTNEYGDLNLYNIYYSPVLVYPDDTPEEEIDDTQEVVNNTYTTNNYYETTKNINIDFDVSFGDISGSDIQHGFDDFGNFSNGFGGFIGKLSSWVLALFPFLNSVVASAIVVVFGLIVLIAIIAFVLKIANIIADILPF